VAKLLHLLQTPWPELDDAPRVRRVGALTFWAETLVLQTAGPQTFLDITDEVLAVVRRAAIQQGWVAVFCKHTTAGIVINENEPHLLKELTNWLIGGGPSIPVAEGRLDLGDRQRVLVLELDGARAREVVVQAFGA
jgi:thiamine phosphate synthase YjbQ (UPF0047 family)